MRYACDCIAHHRTVYPLEDQTDAAVALHSFAYAWHGQTQLGNQARVPLLERGVLRREPISEEFQDLAFVPRVQLRGPTLRDRPVESVHFGCFACAHELR